MVPAPGEQLWVGVGRAWGRNPLVSPGVCCFVRMPQFLEAMVCRGALGYAAFPARSGKYLAVG